MIILCPKCGERNWSSDYFVCSQCSYEESREFALLEENKDYFDGRGKGDIPQLDLGFWVREQKDLTKEMINECLPKGKYNWRLECGKSLGASVWGTTEYHENDFQEANLFIKRHGKELIGKGSKKEGFIYYVDRKGKVVEAKPYNYPIYPNYSSKNWGILCCPCSRPTKIIIPQWVLQEEGEYQFDGWGYFPTIPHETAHADPSVHRHPNYQPFSEAYSPGLGHDTIWNNKQREFYDKLVAKGYKEKVKQRFKVLRKIEGRNYE